MNNDENSGNGVEKLKKKREKEENKGFKREKKVGDIKKEKEADKVIKEMSQLLKIITSETRGTRKKLSINTISNHVALSND